MKERFKSAWRGWNLDFPVITEKAEECHHVSHILSDIDRGSLKVRDGMNEAERKNYVSASSLIFKQPTFKTEKDSLIEEQVYWIAENCPDKDLPFHRGTINGIQIFYEQFQNMHNEHMNNINPKEEPDSPIPSLDLRSNQTLPDK